MALTAQQAQQLLQQLAALTARVADLEQQVHGHGATCDDGCNTKGAGVAPGNSGASESTAGGGAAAAPSQQRVPPGGAACTAEAGSSPFGAVQPPGARATPLSSGSGCNAYHNGGTPASLSHGASDRDSIASVLQQMALASAPSAEAALAAAAAAATVSGVAGAAEGGSAAAGAAAAGSGAGGGGERSNGGGGGGGGSTLWSPQHSAVSRHPRDVVYRRLPSVRSGSIGESSAGNGSAGGGRDGDGGGSNGGVVVGVPMMATRVVTNHIVSLTESNGLGIGTGGQLLSWIDICAGLAAKMLARAPCVTASVDSVHFLRPCRVGSVVLVAAMVNRTFRSSMEVGVRVEEEDVATGVRHHCCSAYLTFVNLDAKKGGKSLPRVVATAPRLQEVYEQALQRRDERLHAKRDGRPTPGLATAGGNGNPLLPVTHAEYEPSIPPLQPLVRPADGSTPTITPSHTTAHMTQLIMPQHANSIGITFGGQVMRWMEQCAVIACSRVVRGGGHILLAAMDGVAFQHPTRVGDVLYVSAQVTAIFGSSVEVYVCVHGEDPALGAMFSCGSAFCTVVSVDGGGEPMDIPFELRPQTQAELARMQDAYLRREERLVMRKSLLEEQHRKSRSRRSLDLVEGGGAGGGAAGSAGIEDGIVGVIRTESQDEMMAYLLKAGSHTSLASLAGSMSHNQLAALQEVAAGMGGGPGVAGGGGGREVGVGIGGGSGGAGEGRGGGGGASGTG